MKAAIVASSVWVHIKCGACAEWFAIEDSGKPAFYCAHCGIKNSVQEQANESINQSSITQKAG